MIVRAILGLVVGSLLLCAAAAKPAVKQIGYYSADAVPIWGGHWRKIADNASVIAVKSPDGLSEAVFTNRDDDGVSVVTRGIIGSIRFKMEGVNSEMLWAPDSKSFFVTYSDGGSVGDYHLYVVRRGQGGAMDLTPLIARRFGNPVRCAPVGKPNFQDGPNVAGIAWLDGSDHLLVAAEIPPHSVCDSMGTFRAYDVDLTTLHITESYDQITAKARFGRFLGEELRAAEDMCVRQPKRCYVSFNHPELARH